MWRPRISSVLPSLQRAPFVALVVMALSCAPACAEGGTVHSVQARKTALWGYLWNGDLQQKIAGGHVFVLASDAKDLRECTLLGHSITQGGTGRDVGFWQVPNLPPSGDVNVVGFHPKYKRELAVRKVSLQGRYQEYRGLETGVVWVEGGTEALAENLLARLRSTFALYEDFDDDNLGGWQNVGFDGRQRLWPDVSAGVILGKGEGYGGPTDGGCTISKHMGDVDVSQGFTLEFRAVSGSRWPNVAAIRLADAWGTVADYYLVRVYGEGNRRFDLVKLDMGRETVLGEYSLGASVHEWHTYKLKRDASGKWTLYIDGREETGTRFKPDITHGRFTHIQLHLLKCDSRLDWVKLVAKK